jgi:hypothetical protein
MIEVTVTQMLILKIEGWTQKKARHTNYGEA